MLFKDKELHEAIERNTQHQNTIQEEIQKLSKELHERLTQLEDTQTQHSKQLAQLGQTTINNAQELSRELERIRHAATHFERAISNFEHLKGKLDTILIQHLEDFTKEHADKLTQKINNYHAVSNELSTLTQALERTAQELQKFTRISDQIKEQDFTLQQHARNLELADRKKLELERENDQLKSILAKMKKRINTNH